MSLKTYHRQEEVRALLPEYPEQMREHCAKFTDHKAHLVTSGGHKALFLEATVSAHDFRDTFCKLARNRELALGYYNTPGISQSAERHMMNGEVYFHGSTNSDFIAELMGESTQIQEQFVKAVAELEKTGLKQALDEGSGFKKKRRRCTSEHDGDYDLERKWDAHPFVTTILDRKEFPIVELIFPIVNSGGTDHKDITRFGARCLALADLLEKAGYRVAITAEDWCATSVAKFGAVDAIAPGLGLSVGEVETIAGTGTRFIIRSANDYGDIQSMALFGSAGFYRRCGFSMNYEANHYIHGLNAKTRKHNVASGYGSCLYQRPIPTEQGQIFLSSEMMQKLFTSDAITAQEFFKTRILFALKCKQVDAEAS